jgi:hypothetical protein
MPRRLGPGDVRREAHRSREIRIHWSSCRFVRGGDAVRVIRGRTRSGTSFLPFDPTGTGGTAESVPRDAWSGQVVRSVPFMPLGKSPPRETPA